MQTDLINYEGALDRLGGDTDFLHELKGASANLDITKLFQLFRELEERAEKEIIEGADALLSEINTGTDELRTFVANL